MFFRNLVYRSAKAATSPRGICRLTLLLLGSCITPYSLTSNIFTGYLVVTGYINTGPNPTIIDLSRSHQISDTAQSPAELHALIYIEDSLGHAYPLAETGRGGYEADGLNLDTSLKYRLFIQTINGEEYFSDYVKPQYSPPIDSVSWSLVNGGVQIYTSTHDSLGITPYYRWDYLETYEYRTSFMSDFEFINGKFLTRPQGQSVQTCWVSDSALSILLNADPGVGPVTVNQLPITFIPPHAEQLNIMYNINVRQYALSLGAYSYWQLLQKTTQIAGTLFDPLPVTALGNLHCMSNPSEPVIGFISAGEMQQVRIFIAYDQIPPGWARLTDCGAPIVVPDSVVNSFGNLVYNYPIVFGSGAIVPLYPDGPHAFFGAPGGCTVCTDHLHSTNIKPAYWP